jgi:branched-chain amino acid transport system permease protein
VGDFVQVAYTAAILGAAYSLMGSGLTLVWGGLRFPNMAHGALFTFGGFMSYLLVVSNGLPSWLGLLAGFFLTAGLGALLHLGLYRPLLRRESWPTATLIAGLGVAIALQAWLTIESPREQQLPPIIGGGITLPGDVPATAEGLFVIGFSLVMVIGLIIFFGRSSLGMQARAVAEDRAGAAITGISVEGIFLLIMTISAGLAGIAGVLLGSIYSISPSSGFTALIFALVVTVVGGLGSFGGSVFAAYAVGATQSATAFWLGSQWVLPVVFAGLMIFLVLRPQGLAGKLTFEPGA